MESCEFAMPLINPYMNVSECELSYSALQLKLCKSARTHTLYNTSDACFSAVYNEVSVNIVRNIKFTGHVTQGILDTE